MRMRLYVVSMLIIILSGCYMPISGRVIDAETQQPIEGAVVLVEWTKTHGIGDHWTESYKALEAISDKEGTIKLEGCYSPFVNPPHVTVYKKGYVAWNSEFIYPDYKERKDYSWGRYIYKLIRFKSDYTYSSHVSFIRASIRLSQNYEAKRVIDNAFDWEKIQAFEEREKIRK